MAVLEALGGDACGGERLVFGAQAPAATMMFSPVSGTSAGYGTS